MAEVDGLLIARHRRWATRERTLPVYDNRVARLPGPIWRQTQHRGHQLLWRG